MKSSGLFCFLLLFGWFLHCQASESSPPARFHLDLNRTPPQPGAETERIIQIFSTSSNTNLAKGHESVTNNSHFLELKGRERILTWDTRNDMSKVEFTVDRFVAGNDGQTNEIVKPGTQIAGTSILGETFFESNHRSLPEKIYEQLKKAYDIRPRDFNEFAHAKIPPSLAVGETWKISAPTNIMAAASFLGASFTNHVKAEGRFVGSTNLFGLNCFHLRFHIKSTELPASLLQAITSHLPVAVKGELSLTVDLIIPFDASRAAVMKMYSMDFIMSGEMVIDGKNVMSSHGRNSLRIISQFQPLKSAEPPRHM